MPTINLSEDPTTYTVIGSAGEISVNVYSLIGVNRRDGDGKDSMDFGLAVAAMRESATPKDVVADTPDHELYAMASVVGDNWAKACKAAGKDGEQ